MLIRRYHQEGTLTLSFPCKKTNDRERVFIFKYLQGSQEDHHAHPDVKSGSLTNIVCGHELQALVVDLPINRLHLSPLIQFEGEEVEVIGLN